MPKFPRLEHTVIVPISFDNARWVVDVLWK
uniref:Uncharacterized protein n=1 Tax=Moniliophthora roreri TaxID=221103 RepID=A0A0W0G1R9_MONRR